MDYILKSLTRTINYQVKELSETLDRHPDFQEFVDIVLSPMNNYKGQDKFVVDALHTLMWQITSYDYSTGLSNPYHRDANVIAELNSFIGNFFLDDSAFAIYKKTFGWKAKCYDDDELWLQSPQILIEAAKDNAEFFKGTENLTGMKLRKAYVSGMKGSGKVEALLAK